MVDSPTVVATQKRPLLAFFSIAFGLSWLVWVPAAMASWGWIVLPLSPAFTGLVGSFGPTVAATLVTALICGREGLGRLFGRLLVWRVPAGWYAFVLLWPAVLSLTATAFRVLLGAASPDFARPPIVEFLPPEALALGLWVLLPFVFVQNLFIGSAMGEEVGWRGYALPRMQARWNALHASALLGVAWWIWHLPIHLSRGHPMADVFPGWTFLSVVGDAVLFTWVFNNTRGSLLLPLLFHASIAVTALFVATAEGTFTIALLLKWVLVAVVVWKAGADHLGPERVAGPQLQAEISQR